MYDIIIRAALPDGPGPCSHIMRFAAIKAIARAATSAHGPSTVGNGRAPLAVLEQV
jgi:hypothetical protein